MLSDVLSSEGSPQRGEDTCEPPTLTLATAQYVAPRIGSDISFQWSEPPFLIGGGCAKIVTDETGKVLWRSAGAALLTSKMCCVMISDGELCGRSRYADTLLRRLLSAAASSAAPVEELFSTSLSESRELYVKARSCVAGDLRVIEVTLRELDRDLSDIPDLCRLYGLTRAEQEITRKMLQGHSVAEIAAELGKAELTVRTHIKRLYVKLNVRTKEQLFAIVLKLMVD